MLSEIVQDLLIFHGIKVDNEANIVKESMREINVSVEKMYPDVEIPFYQTDGSAGCDVKAYIKTDSGDPSFFMIVHGVRGLMIPTGLKIAIPNGYYMAVVPRSGLSVKTNLRVSNSPGTVDSDYRDEVKIIVDNIGIDSRDDIEVKHGDRIAQLVFLPYYQASFDIVEKLNKTERKGGFGSTGK